MAFNTIYFDYYNNNVFHFGIEVENWWIVFIKNELKLIAVERLETWKEKKIFDKITGLRRLTIFSFSNLKLYNHINPISYGGLSRY